MDTVLQIADKNKQLVRQTFPVTGMTCAGCALSVESMLKSAEGVTDAGVNFASQGAWASYDPETTNPAILQKAIRSIGYDLIIDTEDPAGIQEKTREKEYKELKQRTIWSALFSAPVFIIGMFFMDIPYGAWISMVLSIPVVFWFGRSFFINSWKQLRHGKANMDTLVALSTGIAFLFSAFNTIYPEYWHRHGLHAHVYYEAASVIIVFVSLGKLLEDKAKSKTSSAIKKLMGLQAKTVRVITDSGEEEISVELLEPGSLIQLRPGEKVPVDGSVMSGTSYIDESMITGEPLPALKEKGDKLYAGTINQKGAIRFVAEKVGKDTLLAHIIKMVEEAQGSKAPVQKLVDRIAGIFVPVVIGIALLTFAIWIVAGGADALTHALLTSVTVLVIACPCALGLATPTAIMVGVGKGAENNILIKDAESLETAYRVDAVVLDKTGTITEGRPEVNAVFWMEGQVNPDEYEHILYSLEMRSEHPLAEAVLNHLKDRGFAGLDLSEFKSHTGRGVSGVYEGKTYFAGNKELIMDKAGLPDQQLEHKASMLQQQANTVIWFADERRALAVIAISDRVKTSSKEAIKALQESDIDVYMLTGDNEQTAAAIASEVEIKHFKAGVLPSGKAGFIKELQAAGKVVAMVGDGINDSEALAQADVSIAMGKGSDIAMDVAKITLISSDLRSVAKALKLSARTVGTIRQNLFWAFIYNLLGIPLAAGVLYSFNGFLLSPMLAGAAMALSSVSVVSNSLRLRYIKL